MIDFQTFIVFVYVIDFQTFIVFVYVIDFQTFHLSLTGWFDQVDTP